MQTLTEKLLTFALGRSLEYYDMPAVRKIVRDAAQEDYRFSAILTGIATSPPFLLGRKPGAEVAVEATAANNDRSSNDRSSND